MLRLGEILVRHGAVTEDQVAAGLGLARQRGLQIGQFLVQERHCSEDQLADALAEKFGLSRIRLGGFRVDSRLLAHVRPHNVERLHVIPVGVGTTGPLPTLAVATAHPEDVQSLDELRLVTGMEVEPRIATHSEITQLVDEIFGRGQDAVATEDLSMIEVLIDQLVTGEYPTLVLQEGNVPVLIRPRDDSPHMDEEYDISTVADLSLLGDPLPARQYEPVSVQDMENALTELMGQRRLAQLRRDGNITHIHRVRGIGKFRFQVWNYRQPANGNGHGSAHDATYTIRIDLVTRTRGRQPRVAEEQRACHG